MMTGDGTHSVTSLLYHTWHKEVPKPGIFSCDQAALRTRLSVRLLHVTHFFSQCSCHRIILKFSLMSQVTETHLQMTCSNLTKKNGYRGSGRSNGHQGTCPCFGLLPQKLQSHLFFKHRQSLNKYSAWKHSSFGWFDAHVLTIGSTDLKTAHGVLNGSFRHDGSETPETFTGATDPVDGGTYAVWKNAIYTIFILIFWYDNLFILF